MDAAPPKGFVARLKALERRADAWAAKRLTPEEYEDAAALDRRIKAHFWRWLGYFAGLALAAGLLVYAIWPQLGYLRSVFYAALALLYVLAAFVSAWFGWRKYTRRPAWKVLLVFTLLLVGGAAVGFATGNLQAGRPLGSIDAAKGMRAMGIAVALGLALAGFLMGVAHLRLREATLKSARLQAEADRERLARQGAQAELKLLQAQVEPHFLFNTLANVRQLVQAGSPEAIAMLDHLIRYLRMALPEIRGEGSTLGREAGLARAYLEIMRIRMGSALEFSVEVPPELEHAAFPPFMLMTLVENAIKHGVGPLGSGRIDVRAAQSAGVLRVEVEDDGQGLGGAIGQGVGLGNVRERLRTIHGEGARLELLGREPRGALARIEVPS